MNASMLISCNLHSSAADYDGEKGKLDGVIVVWQSGIPRDVIAR